MVRTLPIQQNGADMMCRQTDRPKSMGLVRRVVLAGMLFVSSVGIVAMAAEPMMCPPSPAQFSPTLPLPPIRVQRPAEGPESIAAFVDGIGQNDAGFDILVGQGRILTTKMDLAVRGQAPALVAVGDPT